MNHKMIDFNSYLKKQLQGPKFRREWEAGEAQYQLVRAIIKARIAKKLSQRQLAQKAYTTQAVISRIESMSVNPSIILIEKIAQALDQKLEIRFVSK